MNDWIRQLHSYCETHTSAPPEVLRELDRETHLKTLAPQMLSGSLQGRFLALISRLVRPKTILEIGTFTGYGALCLAEGLADDAVLHTLEGNGEILHIARKYIEKAGLMDRIHLHEGNALELIPKLPGTFDLVFIDANKQEYPAYFELVADRIPSGGLMIADNVLWSGKVLDPGDDADARILDEFNQQIQADERFENLMLPLRDGLLIAQRR